MGFPSLPVAFMILSSSQNFVSPLMPGTSLTVPPPRTSPFWLEIVKPITFGSP